MTMGLNKQTVGGALVLVLVAVGGWYVYTHGVPGTGGPAAAGSSEAVATVNGDAITRAELDRAEAQFAAQQGQAATSTEAKAAYQSQALESLEARTLLLQAATKAGFSATSAEVDAQIASTTEQLGGADAYAQALTAQGLTADSYRKEVTENIAIQAYLAQTLDFSSLTASESEIQALYQQLVGTQQGAPKLADVHDQVAQLVIQQKQQQLIQGQVAKLKEGADIKVLI